MDTKYGRRNFGKALLFIIGTITTSYSNVSTFFDLPTVAQEYRGYAVVFGVTLCLIAILWHFMDLQTKISIIENTRPNVRAIGTELETPFHLIRGGVPSEILERYYVVFRNEKAKGISVVDTQPVHAIIFVLDSDCINEGRLYHEKAFWAGAGEPWNRGKDYSVTIKASGKPESLCLFVRQQGGSDLFIFNDDSYISNFRSLEPFQDRLRIPFQKFYMAIRLIAGNLEMNDIFVSVTNLGVQQPPRIIILSENPCVGKKL